MTGWHPLTKLVVASGTLAIGWLVVSGPSEAPATVSAVRARPVDAASAGPDPILGDLLAVTRRFDPPPREQFATLLERPLFTPTRRPAARAPEPIPVAADQPDEEEVEPVPPFRLVGTVSRRCSTEALVSLDAGGGLARLAPGHELSGWVVIEIGADRLEVERDGVRHLLQILR